MRTYKITYRILIAMIFLASMVSCKDELLNRKTEIYSVTFVFGGEDENVVEEVYAGSTIRKPSIPYRERAFFVGWYQDAELVHSFSYGMPVYSDLVLYAKWKPGYVISFDTNGGSYVDNDTVVVNGTAVLPDEPFKENAVFVGWYDDMELTEEFDFGLTQITEDITLYAKWIDGITVTFETGTPKISVPSVGLMPGETVDEPEPLTFTDSTFLGWYADPEGTVEFDFSAPISVNTTVYAKWFENMYTVNYNSTNKFYDITGLKPEYANVTRIYIPHDINGERIANIGANAFQNNTNITEVFIEDGINNMHIGSFAFDGCTNLKTLRLPTYIGNMKQGAFSHCTSLGPELVFPEKANNNYENKVFYGCTSLERVYLTAAKNGVTTDIFNGCSNLKEVYIAPYDNAGTIVPKASPRIFDNCHPDLRIYVPADAVEQYKLKSGWDIYADIIYPRP